jgi:PAS domain S-box-containing protein
VLWANKTQLQLLGYSAQELIGKNLTEFTTDSTEVLHKKFELLNAGGVLKNHS